MGSDIWRVVLVGPENPLNLGFVARAMLCFGVEDLVIAGSDWKSVPPEAHRTGAAAPAILEGVRFVPRLEDAIEDCATAVAFSRRPSALRRPQFTLPAAPPRLARAGRAALVFGRESNGLTREESSLCPFLARIPCQGGVSLNLGQAVAVALFSLTAPAAKTKEPESRPEASLEMALGLWKFLEPRIASAPRFTAGRLQRIRQMLYRLRLDDEDFSLLFAVMKALAAETHPA